MNYTTCAVALGGLLLLCAPQAQAWTDSAPAVFNSTPPVAYTRGENMCPLGLHPVTRAGQVFCGGTPTFNYVTVSSLDDVPEGYTGRVYVLNPADSGYQEFVR